MIKVIAIVLLLLAEISPAFSQFNPVTAEKSLVKVMVTADNKMGVCSGFLWKKTSWVVTSLHAMKNGGKIQVVYAGNNIREATVIKVFNDADLVLLQTNIDAKPLSNDVVALSTFHQGEVTFGEKIYAIGYNGGSKGDQTQALEKGHANPETLEFLVRAEDKAALTSVGFPSMTLPIYFLSGSLLPGFSGSPVYNQKNELIGIGDGGLERGLMNVSWCIPASNLTALENSTVTSLPANLAKASQHYSAEVSIEIPKDDAGSGNQQQQVEQQIDKQYSSFSYKGFNFYQTKSRSWEEMKRTSIDPGNMESISSEFKANGLNADYDVLNFDIYEDINNGFVIAIPEGTQLYYDEEYDEFSVNLDSFEEGQYFSLYYYMVQHQGDPVSEVISEINESWSKEVQGLTLDPHYTRTDKINDEWTADYRLFQGNSTFVEEGYGEVSALFYLNVIHNKDVGFYSLAVCLSPVGRQDLSDAFEKGIDCVNHYDQNTSACDYFESLMQIIASAHLTTKSSIY